MWNCTASFAQSTEKNDRSVNQMELRRKSKDILKKSIQVSRTNIEEAKNLALEGLMFAKKSESDSLILNASKTLGILYKMLENIDSSQYYSKQGIQYADKMDNKRVAATLTTLVANTYTESGQYETAYTYFYDAEQRYRVLNRDSIDPTYFYFKINKANLFNSLTLYDLMLEELFDAQRTADSIADTNFTTQILGSIAIGYKHYGDLKKSTEYSKKSLNYVAHGELDEAIILTNIGNNFSRMKEVDSALYYYGEARKIYTDRNAGDVSFCRLDLNVAEMYLENDRADDAEKILFQINDSIPSSKDRARLNLLKSKLSKQNAEKLKYGKEALKYAVLSSEMIIQKDSYLLLYEAYKEEGKFSEALSNYEHYQELEDSIFNREKSKAIQKVVLQKALGEKDAEIRLAQLKFEKDKAEKDKTILFAVLAIVLILFIAIMIYLRYRSQKQKTMIETQAKELLETENDSIKNELVHLLFQSDQNFHVLSETKNKLKSIKQSPDKDAQINSLFALINGFVASEKEKRKFQEKFKGVRDDFFERVGSEVKLTKTEKKLAALLKLDLSTKEIAVLLNVTEATVEVYRSRLRKKLNIDKDSSLTEFLNTL